MSGWYWLLWAVLTAVNVALLLAAWRNLRQTLALTAPEKTAALETWTEWGVRRTSGDVGSVAQMEGGRSVAEACARRWPGDLVSRTVIAQPWEPVQ